MRNNIRKQLVQVVLWRSWRAIVFTVVSLREAGAHWAKRLLVPRLHYFSALPLQIGASLSSNLGTNKEALELSSSSLWKNTFWWLFFCAAKLLKPHTLASHE